MTDTQPTKTRKSKVNTFVNKLVNANKNHNLGKIESHREITTEEFVTKKIQSILHEFFIYDTKKLEKTTEKESLSKIEKLNLSYLMEYSSEDIDFLQDCFYQMSPPHLSLYLMKGKVSLTRELIARFELEFQNDNQGRTALHYATFGGNLDSIKFLLEEHQFNINEQDEDGLTPLIIAAHQGNIEIVSHLIESGANLNLTDKTGKTALHYGVLTSNYNLVSLLIESKINCNHQDKSGSTALHYAAYINNLSIVKSLINKGKTKLNLVNHGLIDAYGMKAGFTAIDYAKGPVKTYLRKRHCQESSNAIKSLVTLKGIVGGALIGAGIGFLGLIIIAFLALILSVLSVPILLFQELNFKELLNSSFIIGSSFAVIGGVSTMGAVLGPVWSNLTHFKFSKEQISIPEQGEIFDFPPSKSLIINASKAEKAEINSPTESDNLNAYFEKQFKEED